MMRITRDDEQYIGRARPALHSRVKVGFRKDGRITALDGFVVVDNGPYDVVSDSRSAGDHISLCYQPMAMRWRTLTVLTNTPPRGAQRAPGGHAGQRADGADPRQGRAQARHRRGRDPPHQRARGQGAVRRAQRARHAELHDQRVPQGGARQGRRAVQVGGAEGAERHSGTARRCAASASPSAPTRPDRWASTASSSSSRTAA